MSDLNHLIYASSSTRLMQEQDLVAILTKSHENNARLDVTGMLLYRGGNFLQVLEGQEAVIDDLFKVIMQDPRHHQVTLLLKRAVPSRQFEHWEMGFTNIDTIDTSTLPGYTPYLSEPFNSHRFKDANFAYTFLNMFKESMR
ncbi:MAG: BLUF domain-containing protein [Anaerolineae bacterium]|nr:BLUF domain-containing protein [Anaerolineae bacterium]